MEQITLIGTVKELSFLATGLINAWCTSALLSLLTIPFFSIFLGASLGLCKSLGSSDKDSKVPTEIP